MKTEELKRIAKENDYELKESIDKYRLTHKYCDNYISINGLCKNRLWISIPFCCDERDFNMIKAAVEFAETPPEDREEEKKFYAKHRYLVQSDDYMTAFLNYNTNYDRLFVYTKGQVCGVKTQFTLKEIEEIKKRFNTDLADFELIEVKE